MQEEDLKSKLKEFLSVSKTNREIVEKGIIEGALPKKINEILKEFETDNHLEIEVIEPEFKRRKKAFYLTEKKEKIKKEKIRIQYKKNEQN